MSKDQCLDRAELCLDMARAHRSVTMRKTAMVRAHWLWLFVWVGMFE